MATGSSRSRWAAVGAAVAVGLGSGGLITASAEIGSGERATYVAITPCRLLDTRAGGDNVGRRSVALGAGDTHTVAYREEPGRCVLPADATALAMNVAIIEPTAESFLTVHPSDQLRPLAATLNWRANQSATSNFVTVDLPSTGRISFFNLKGTVHLAVDVVGYYVDHHHDDRYYTKAQVDAAIAARTTSRPPSPFVALVDPAAFVPVDDTASTFFDPPTGALTGSGCFRAPVTLPHGARATLMTVHGHDSSSGTDTTKLYRNGWGSHTGVTVIAETTSGNVGSFVSWPVQMSEPIDNFSNSYFLVHCFAGGGTFWLHDVTITYDQPT